jgi:hypothetical protein
VPDLLLVATVLAFFACADRLVWLCGRVVGVDVPTDDSRAVGR